MIYDLCIILTVAVFAFVGYKRKASGTLLGLCVYVVSAALSLWLSKILSLWIYDSFLNEWIYESVSEKLSAIADATAESAALTAFDMIPGFLLNFFSYFSFDAEMLKSGILENAGEGISKLSQYVADLLRSPVTGILNILLCFLLFIVLLILLKKLSKLLLKAFELPLVSDADAWLGCALGVLEGLLTVILVSSVIMVCLPVVGDSFASVTDTVFGNSYCLSILRDFFETHTQLFIYNINKLNI